MRGIIRDDIGFSWKYNPKTSRIECLEDNSKPKNKRGFPCRDLAHGIHILNVAGYITNKKRKC